MTKEHLQGHYLIHLSLSTYSRYADATIHEGGVRLVAWVADAWLFIISESTGPFLNIHHLCQVKAPRWKHKIQRNSLRQCSQPRGCRCTSCPRRLCSIHLNYNQCCSFCQLKAFFIPPMSFFSGASNIKVTGGEFNEVRGNYIVYDQSRHHSNVNSLNTTTRTVLNSGNNNSCVYCKYSRCLSS